MGKIGRPEEDDSEPLYAMAEIVHSNPEMNLAGVIRIVIQSMTNFHSEEAITKRLRRKFERHREFLMDRVRSHKERPVVYLPPQRLRTVGVDLSTLGWNHHPKHHGIGLKVASAVAQMQATIDRTGCVAACMDTANQIGAAAAQMNAAMVRLDKFATRMDTIGRVGAAAAAMNRISRVSDIAAGMNTISKATRTMERMDAMSRVADRAALASRQFQP